MSSEDAVRLSTPQSGARRRALLVDLNNSARYPTLAIGYLVAALRGAGYIVRVLAPLSYGVPALVREGQETRRQQLQRRVYFNTHPVMQRTRDTLRSLRSRWQHRPNPVVLSETAGALEADRPDVVLLSAYMDHHPSVVAVSALAAERGVPVLLGGPAFNLPQLAQEWRGIPGLRAIVGAEVDFALPEIVDDAIEGRDLSRRPGVFLPDGRQGPPAPPLPSLAGLPVPDFTDFPWGRYPNRVIPTMTGRGCSWGRCTFCSDVVTANGRGFRSRPVDEVFAELETQSRRHGSTDVIFLDIKLNSELAMWRGIIERFQDHLPGGRWIGTVHVDATGDNGLSADALRAAWAAGMRRTTFGLETGSQRLNNRMAKGTDLDRTSAFIRDAHAAGISVRTTMMLGYPGETAADIDATNRYLRLHRRYLDRVRLSRFKAIPGTRFHEQYERMPERFPGLRRFEWDFRHQRASYEYAPAADPAYRRAQRELLNLVHAINRRALREDARAFDGLM